MSIQSEIDRLALAKDDLADAITSKGVAVPQGAKLDRHAKIRLRPAGPKHRYFRGR